MDSLANIKDTSTTVAGVADQSPGTTLTSGYFDYSCNDINSPGNTN